MIVKIGAEQRFQSDLPWVRSWYQFSFSEYWNTSRSTYSVLRVFNEHVLQPNSGYGYYYRENIDMMFLVLQGTLEHIDSLGNQLTLTKGDILLLNAGSGITHKEFNRSKKNATRYLQVWIEPNEKNHPPRCRIYKKRTTDTTQTFESESSGGRQENALRLCPDVEIFLWRFNHRQKGNFNSQPSRHLYIYIIDGHININNISFNAGDSAEITSEQPLTFDSAYDARILLIVLPAPVAPP